MAPAVALGRAEVAGGLVVTALLVAWRWRREWRARLKFTGLEWLALVVLVATFVTRFWVIRDWPYPPPAPEIRTMP